MDLAEGQIGITESRDPPGTELARLPGAGFFPIRPIGELLIAAGLIGDGDLARGLAFQKQYGGRLGSILVRLGAVSEERLLPILSAQLNIPALNESDLPVDPTVHLSAIRESGFPIDWWVDQDAL